MESARLFLAIDVDGRVRKRLVEAMRELKGVVPGARWCREEGLHLTLWFFGTVPLKVVEEIGAAVEPVARGQEVFSYSLRGIGGFPSLARPRVLWAGVGEGAEKVKIFAGAVRGALEARGFGGEEREFVPHVTLGRLGDRGRVEVEKLERVVALLNTREFGSSEVEELVLYASELRKDGPVYSVVESWALGGS